MVSRVLYDKTSGGVLYDKRKEGVFRLPPSGEGLSQLMIVNDLSDHV